MGQQIKASKYQQAILDWVANGSGDGAVNAVAGSGKTTTLTLATQAAKGSVLFLAFNKSIVEELARRMPAGTQVQTLNSLGHRALCAQLGKVKLDAGKYRDLAADNLKLGALGPDCFGDALKATASLVSYAQSTLASADNDALAELAANFGVDIPTKVDQAYIFETVHTVLAQGEALARKGTISFDDQIWLPVKWELTLPQVDWVFVDECQDLSRAKLELVMRIRARRRLFVGDPRQAIYGFAGADSASFENIVTRTRATVLPLSVCYRCPASIVKQAQSIVPEIEAAPGAVEGKIESISHDQLPKVLGRGDMILCRLTAPLIKTCLELIAAKVSAKVRGRDIGKSLIALAKEAMYLGEWKDFGSSLAQAVRNQADKLEGRKNKASALESLHDRAAALRVCYESFTSVRNFGEFCAQLEGLFTDENGFVELTTIHRAKGLEADNVFILAPGKLPLTWAGQLDWQLAQEMNLKYVAVTRAKKALHFVYA